MTYDLWQNLPLAKVKSFVYQIFIYCGLRTQGFLEGDPGLSSTSYINDFAWMTSGRNFTLQKPSTWVGHGLNRRKTFAATTTHQQLKSSWNLLWRHRTTISRPNIHQLKEKNRRFGQRNSLSSWSNEGRRNCIFLGMTLLSSPLRGRHDRHQKILWSWKRSREERHQWGFIWRISVGVAHFLRDARRSFMRTFAVRNIRRKLRGNVLNVILAASARRIGWDCSSI